jgi:hypothetical protein
MVDDFSSFKSRPKTSWAANKGLVLPDGTIVPAPPEEKKKPAVPVPDPLPSWIKDHTPMANGFRRTLQYIKDQTKRGLTGDDVRTTAAKFVQDYPSSVRRVDNDYWTGMQHALEAYTSQDPTFWRALQIDDGGRVE